MTLWKKHIVASFYRGNFNTKSFFFFFFSFTIMIYFQKAKLASAPQFGRFPVRRVTNLEDE